MGSFWILSGVIDLCWFSGGSLGVLMGFFDGSLQGLWGFFLGYFGRILNTLISNAFDTYSYILW